MMKKIKNILKQSLTIVLGIVLGTTISIYASSVWHDTNFLQTAINENRVLKPNELQKIKDNLDYLENKINGIGWASVNLNDTKTKWDIDCIYRAKIGPYYQIHYSAEIDDSHEILTFPLPHYIGDSYPHYRVNIRSYNKKEAWGYKDPGPGTTDIKSPSVTVKSIDKLCF